MKNRNRAIVILSIVFAAFNLIVLAIPFRRGAVFWTAYAFADVAIAAQYVIAAVAFSKAETLKSKVFGYPIFKIGYIWLLVQLILSCVLMLIAQFVSLPAWVAIVPCAVLCGAAAVGVLATDAARDEIERQETAIRINTTFMSGFNADVCSLLPRADYDDTLKSKLEKLAEDARYSDPVSGDGLEHIEAQIGGALDRAKELITAGDAAAPDAVDELSKLLYERNQKCRLLKQQR
ncbi:MAG: hypothetical protein LBK23_06885 [Oscillospiraceae bacterium]|jgi:hypothetical protein|nr:hypothetical protein [Oscillospiraceae bacterium]